MKQSLKSETRSTAIVEITSSVSIFQ